MNEPLSWNPAAFGEAWAGLEPQLRLSLSSAPAHVVDDVLQETSIKLLRVWGSIDHDRPVLPFAVTIARNTLRDELRRLARHEHVELSEATPIRDDLDAVVSARLELARVGAELTRLTAGQREALLTEVGGGSKTPDSPRVKMLRSRARARLRELVAQAGGFVVTGVARLRSSAAGRALGEVPDVGILAQALFLAVVAAGAVMPPADAPGIADMDRSAVAAPAADRAGRSAPGVRVEHSAVALVRARSSTHPDVPVAAPSASGGGSPSPATRLPAAPIPRAQGSAGDHGYFGTEGVDFAASGSNSAAGQDVGWSYEGKWETPKCVQRLAEGEAPGECKPTAPPSAAAEVEAAGRRHRVDTDGGR